MSFERWNKFVESYKAGHSDREASRRRASDKPSGASDEAAKTSHTGREKTRHRGPQTGQNGDW